MKKIIFEIISSLRTHDLKADAISFSMQVGAMLLNLLINLLLANIMLPADYGAFAYSTTLIFVLAGIGTFGTQNLLVREVGAGLAANNLSNSKILLGWSLRRSIPFVLILISLFIFIAFQFNLFFRSQNLASYTFPMLVSLAAVPLLVIIYINQSYLQGLRKIFSALFAEKIVKPFLFLVAVTILFFSSQETLFAFNKAALINVASFLAASIILVVSVSRLNKNTAATAPEKHHVDQWTKSSMTFFLFSIVTLLYLRTDILCLGFYQSPEQIGIYNISCRVADTVSFPLHILTFGLAPMISGLFHSDDKLKLQATVTASTRLIFLLSVIPALLFIFFGTPILNLFGKHFEAGYTSFMILIFANLINALAGPAGYVLAMTGHERLAFLSMTVACLVNIAMNLVLIPLYGINGAAIAVSLAMLTWNILIVVFTVKKTGIRPDIFYLLKRK
ncbi:MAG TPA: polysaccharide biosynthesis C-terminal domain-containing protein [Bacteroidia bacterium]|nr:polysaccharide biosynthesis C-terminal domain-containing protein [Bacteroidia bacterium]